MSMMVPAGLVCTALIAVPALAVWQRRDAAEPLRLALQIAGVYAFGGLWSAVLQGASLLPAMAIGLAAGAVALFPLLWLARRAARHRLERVAAAGLLGFARNPAWVRPGNGDPRVTK